MSTLFTDEKPKPFAEYPPNDAYYAIQLLGLIPAACFLLAPFFAYKYPGVGWRWGVWAAAPLFLAGVLMEVRGEGFPAGLIAALANPVLWAIPILSCLLAVVGARVGMSRRREAK